MDSAVLEAFAHLLTVVRVIDDHLIHKFRTRTIKQPRRTAAVVNQSIRLSTDRKKPAPDCFLASILSIGPFLQRVLPSVSRNPFCTILGCCDRTAVAEWPKVRSTAVTLD